jgi:AcrR family transcriptional regulator
MPGLASDAIQVRSERAERTRQRILDAAGQSFATVGYAKTTVEGIAARAGVSKALVYQHFRGKEAIHQAVLERTLEEWAEACRVEGGSVLARIGEMHRRALAYARGDPVLRALFHLDELVLRDLGRSSAVRQALDDFRSELIELVQEGVDSGELRDDLDPTRAADVIRIQHMGFIDQLLNPEWMGACDEELVEASIAVLCTGLARKGNR